MPDRPETEQTKPCRTPALQAWSSLSRAGECSDPSAWLQGACSLAHLPELPQHVDQAVLVDDPAVGSLALERDDPRDPSARLRREQACRSPRNVVQCQPGSIRRDLQARQYPRTLPKAVALQMVLCQSRWQQIEADSSMTTCATRMEVTEPPNPEWS